MTYAALANHRQPHLDCLAYLSQLVLHQLNVSKLPLLALIYQNNISWRSYRMFFRDPSMATSKQTYYDLSTMLLKVVSTMPDALVKTKVQPVKLTDTLEAMLQCCWQNRATPRFTLCIFWHHRNPMFGRIVSSIPLLPVSKPVCLIIDIMTCPAVLAQCNSHDQPGYLLLM